MTKMLYKIMGRDRSKKGSEFEEIDSIEGSEESTRLVEHYRAAFHNGWHIIKRKKIRDIQTERPIYK